MRRLQGRLAEVSLFDAIRTIHGERLSGVLRVEAEGSPKRFVFRGGELHLATSHPLADRVLTILAAAGPGDPELRELLRKIAEAMASWREGAFSFEEGEPAGDLVGPLPTAFLSFAGEVMESDETQLLRRLGGEEALWSAVPDPDPARLGELETPEAFLLSRLETPFSVRDLASQAGVPRRLALARLCRLKDLGVARRHPAEEPVAVARVEELVSREVRARFLERIGESLDREPLTLPPEAHRERVKAALARIGGLDHYEILRVGPEAAAEEVHEAYTELARLAHPRHAGRLGLGDRREGLDLLFERVTEAYLVLADPERRKVYDLEAGVVRASAIAPVPDPEHRHEEKRRMARDCYEAAVSLAELEDYHPAIQLLQQAVAADARFPYLALLAHCLSKNPNWLPEAVRTYERAIGLRPRDADLRAAAGEVHEQLGQAERAHEQYQAALGLAPGHPAATVGISRLKAVAGGWKKKLFGE